jgi:four helix bundle protein
MVKSHKDLICWQLCATLRTLGLTAIRKGRANGDWDFRSQMRRALRSACYQTSEGFYFFKHKPFAHYLDGAYASLGETLDQIDDGHERGYFSEEQQTEMRRLARRAMKCNRRLADWLRNNPDPPSAQPPKRPLRPRQKPPTQNPDYLGHA